MKGELRIKFLLFCWSQAEAATVHQVVSFSAFVHFQTRRDKKNIYLFIYSEQCEFELKLKLKMKMIRTMNGDGNGEKKKGVLEWNEKSKKI